MNFPAIPNFEISERVHKALCYTVYAATDLRSGNRVHLRVLDPNLSREEQSASAFLAGARLVKHLNHPNILRVYDYGEENRLFYVAVEPTRYEPLSSLILETFSLSLKDFLDIFLGIGMAVRQAHLRGLIHGLLHPKCIYINAACDIKIDHFGLQWTIPHVLQSRSKAALYQAKYLAPECFLDPEKADGRGDIYSLGVIMFEMLSGHPPFEGESIEEIRDGHLSGKIPYLDCTALDLPFEIEAILAQSLAKNPLKRFQNFKEYLDLLGELKPAAQTFDISDDSVETTLESIQEETGRNGKRASGLARWDLAAVFDRIKPTISGKRLALPALAFLVIGVIFLVFRLWSPSTPTNDTQTQAAENEPSQALVSNTPIFIPQEEQILEPE
ncbi:MAG: serine/threonine protein kinase, partial [Calditrichaeota bacterium]